MEANESYWREPPQIQRLVWEFVEDRQTRVNALLAGQADVIDRVPPEQLDAVDEADGCATHSVTGIELVNLWNVPGRFDLWDDSPEFREAVMLAIDRAELNRALVVGESPPRTETDARYQRGASDAAVRDAAIARAHATHHPRRPSMRNDHPDPCGDVTRAANDMQERITAALADLDVVHDAHRHDLLDHHDGCHVDHAGCLAARLRATLTGEDTDG